VAGNAAAVDLPHGEFDIERFYLSKIGIGIVNSSPSSASGCSG